MIDSRTNWSFGRLVVWSFLIAQGSSLGQTLQVGVPVSVSWSASGYALDLQNTARSAALFRSTSPYDTAIEANGPAGAAKFDMNQVASSVGTTATIATTAACASGRACTAGRFTGSGGSSSYGAIGEGQTYGLMGTGTSTSAYGVYGSGNNGLFGSGVNGYGVKAQSSNSYGIYAYSSGFWAGYFESPVSVGLVASSGTENGIRAFTSSTSGASAIAAYVLGSGNGNAITGTGGANANGVQGSTTSTFASGVYGESQSAFGGYGVAGRGHGSGIGVYGDLASATTGWAGYFQGRVYSSGNIVKPAGSFLIDHPDDPANKYLYHSFVESPDMMNIYNGIVTTDDSGEAWVELPGYWASLNMEPRYQLTPIGAAEIVFVKREYDAKNNRFQVGGKPHLKISWQVTGVRKDAYANAHRIQVEVSKTGTEKGHYLHPELFNQPDEMAIRPVLGRSSPDTATAPPSHAQLP